MEQNFLGELSRLLREASEICDNIISQKLKQGRIPGIFFNLKNKIDQANKLINTNIPNNRERKTEVSINTLDYIKSDLKPQIDNSVDKIDGMGKNLENVKQFLEKIYIKSAETNGTLNSIIPLLKNSESRNNTDKQDSKHEVNLDNPLIDQIEENLISTIKDLCAFSKQCIADKEKCPSLSVSPNPTPELTEPTDQMSEPTELTDQMSEQTEPTAQTLEPTEPTDQTSEPTEPTDQMSEQTEPTDQTSEQTEPTDQMSEQTEPTDQMSEQTEPTDQMSEQTEPTDQMSEQTEPSDQTLQQTETTDTQSQQTELSSMLSGLAADSERGSDKLLSNSDSDIYDQANESGFYE